MNGQATSILSDTMWSKNCTKFPTKQEQFGSIQVVYLLTHLFNYITLYTFFKSMLFPVAVLVITRKPSIVPGDGIGRSLATSEMAIPPEIKTVKTESKSPHKLWHNTSSKYASLNKQRASLTMWQTKQEAQLMLTTGAMRLGVSRGQQTWYHFGSVATFR